MSSSSAVAGGGVGLEGGESMQRSKLGEGTLEWTGCTTRVETELSTGCLFSSPTVGGAVSSSCGFLLCTPGGAAATYSQHGTIILYINYLLSPHLCR